MQPITIKFAVRVGLYLYIILLEWTQLVCTTSFYGFICVDLTHSVRVGVRHVERNNYVPLFGVDPIECRLTRYYVIRDVSAI